MRDWLTLDFWNNKVEYFEIELLTGTLACEALNISEETITKLSELGLPLMQLAAGMQTMHADPALIPTARESAIRIVDILAELPPFFRIYWNKIMLEVQNCFTAAVAEKFNEEGYDVSLLDAVAGTLSAEDQKVYQLCCLSTYLAQVGFTLAQYRMKLLPIAEALHDGMYAGTSQDYAQHIAELVSEDISQIEQAWTAYTNNTTQYFSHRDASGKPTIARHMHYVTFIGMFRADFFEGLAVGHAPRKCKICGRWFLTTDAHRAVYCDGYAPNDPRGRTCRQVGARLGREERERADNHPVKKIYKKSLDGINKRLSRGTISDSISVTAKRIAKNNMEQAMIDPGYATEKYEKEMQLDTLIQSAQRKPAYAGKE